jgi:MFS superfamily sulfate permease-like transporter
VRQVARTGDTSWLRSLPGPRLARSYERARLRHEVLAGLALAAMLVPAGIAHADAACLPGVCGLYATIVPLLA